MLGRCILLALATTSLACSTSQSETPAADASASAVGIDGTWKSDGYGLVLVAAGDSLKVFEVTETTCMPDDGFVRSDERAEGAEAVYARDDDRVHLLPGAGPASRRLHRDGTASDIVVRRIEALPARCASPTPDTPSDNFEVFTRTWEEQYILFDQKGVDWARVVAEARGRITPATPPDALFAILAGMIAPFHDAHTFIQAPAIDKSFRTLREGTDRVAKHGMASFREQDMPALLAVAERHLRTPLRRFCNDQVQFAHVDDSTGYLRILSESRYTTEGGFAAGLAALEAALDTIFADSAMKGLVIDVRINFGGSDPYGLALAARLTSGPYLAYAKEARADPADRTKWTPGQPSQVTVSTRAGFKGPVVELTGPLTISAGETTTQALMGRTPRVLRIGEHTQGVFSDVLVRRMPNGWRFGLPNEVFRTADGRTFDGPGIPPDIEVPVFADADVAAGRDPALARAMAELYRPR